MGKVGKRLTRKQKEILSSQGLNPKDYIFLYDINESYFKIQHKASGIRRTVDAFKRNKKEKEIWE